MAWKDAYQYAGKLFGKYSNNDLVNSASEHRQARREDVDLPLRARIGGVVQLQKSPFIRALSQGSLISMPEEKDSLIRAISRVRLEIAGSLYRYYLLTGDQDDKECFIQLYQNEAGDISEVMYYSRLTRLIPESSADQEAYSGSAGYGLGDRSYTLWREQLSSLAWDEASLNSIFGDAGHLEFSRDAGDPLSDFVAPFQAQESRIDDAGGQHGLMQDLIFMPYSRALDGQRESLLISTEIVTSQDGDSSRRRIHVDFMIGIPVELDRLLIQ
ncbi:DUF2491 family protein [Undibacterium sp. Jales W-56]|uniref:DUF2491 family protein n=1 Tax=Undibacterium sp. Jales W-56 TaxID=2897325 RepID=UPI0021D396F5|nr:DUF2491 family protein [Undibacterium sp. Jales W-56]MCU6434221.1 DUF2491 family protein [Undibacterium sp. Jales W-56]